MTDFNTSKTKENLLKAFAGESQARNRYTFSASAAKKEGYPILEDLFNYCGRKFSLKTTMMLGIELITRLEFIHHRNFIHRDIKPDNFVVGIGDRANVIYILDFGLSKQYREPHNYRHIPYFYLFHILF